MSAPPPAQQEEAQIVACTVSRDVQQFDLLIEDMETALGESWGDLGFDDAAAFLQQPEAAGLQFITIAMDHEDEARIDTILDVVHAAKGAGVKVILITEDVSPSTLHKLLREGADEFVPYPLPENELANAIERVLLMDDAPTTKSRNPGTGGASHGHYSAAVFPVQGLAGGVGGTTFAVNLAWELANLPGEEKPRVCLLDLDFQTGSASTYLDLPRRESVLELLTDIPNATQEVFDNCLLPVGENLRVLTAPADLIPLEMISSEDIARLVEIARSNFDYVIIDMPTAVVEWTQAVLEAAHLYFALIELDMRSAQNTLRIKRALQSEDLPFEKFRFVLNRAPGFTDLNGKARIKRLADSLGISIDTLMPDGGKPVMQAGDHGAPLGQHIPKNPLRKEIAKLAQSLHEVNVSDAKVQKA